MGRIDNVRESLGNFIAGNTRNYKASDYIDTEAAGVFSQETKTSTRSFNVLGSRLFGNRLKESKSIQSRRDKKISELMSLNDDTSQVLNSVRYVRSPYKYSRIDEFFRKESYFSRSVIRQVETMMRNGYEFNSDNPDALSKLKKQLALFQYKSRFSIDQFVFEIARHLLRYGICVVRKMRDDQGNLTKMICLDPSTVTFRIDANTGIIQGCYTTDYRNIVSKGITRKVSKAFKNLKTVTVSSENPFGKNPGEIPISDLCIGTLYEAGWDIFPEPPCFQMLDDILTLRSLEETIELLSFQFGSPLLHVKVGSDTYPATDTDVERVHNSFVNMAANGMVTTDHNTKVDVINLQKGIADLMPYVEHFKKRVLSGASSSQVSIGESDSGTRSSTESIDNALADHCAYISSIITGMFNSSIIPDILLKNGFNDSTILDKNGEFLVWMEFLDVDVTKMISKENHILSLYQGNSITKTEMRRKMMLPPMSDKEEQDCYLYRVQIPLRMAGADEGASGDASSASTKSKDQPSNQHGSKLSPGSTKK